VDEAVTMANANQINRMGYPIITAKDYDRVVKYFSMNVKSDPKNANWYDSLSEAYKAKDYKGNAIKHFKKSFALNPAANIKTNSKKNLKELSAV
jgi:tetratricopeptide (TPR) repeat protein